MKSKAQTDRIWNNLRQGRGTSTQQKLLAEILQHSCFSLVNITTLFVKVFPSIEDNVNIATITKKRTEALRRALYVLDSLQETLNNIESKEEKES